MLAFKRLEPIEAKVSRWVPRGVEHSNVLCLLNTRINGVQKRLANQLDVIIQALEPYYLQISSIAVGSTFNWYWLVDGLMERGYKLHLANTTAIKQYSSIKNTNDYTDAH